MKLDSIFVNEESTSVDDSLILDEEAKSRNEEALSIDDETNPMDVEARSTATERESIDEESDWSEEGFRLATADSMALVDE